LAARWAGPAPEKIGWFGGTNGEPLWHGPPAGLKLLAYIRNQEAEGTNGREPLWKPGPGAFGGLGLALALGLRQGKAKQAKAQGLKTFGAFGGNFGLFWAPGKEHYSAFETLFVCELSGGIFPWDLF